MLTQIGISVRSTDNFSVFRGLCRNCLTYHADFIKEIYCKVHTHCGRISGRRMTTFQCGLIYEWQNEVCYYRVSWASCHCVICVQNSTWAIENHAENSKIVSMWLWMFYRWHHWRHWGYVFARFVCLLIGCHVSSYGFFNFVRIR